MKIIHRYVLREFIETFLFGLIIFSMILLLDQIFQLINLFLSKGVSFWTVLKLFLLVFPNILSLAIPMSVLFGILLSYGRLSEDNEITALKSTGVHVISFTAPVLIFALFLSIFLLFANNSLFPNSHKKFRQIYQKVLTQRPLIKFEEKTITNIGNYRFYAKSVDEKNGSLHGVNVYKFQKQEDGVPWRITSSSATVLLSPTAVVFQMYDGFWQKPNPNHVDTLVHMNFTKYTFAIPLGGKVLPFSQSLREMTSKQLRKEIKAYKAKKLSTSFFENEYWLRWTLSLAPFIFGFIAVPLGLISKRGGKSIGFGLSLIVIFSYYTLLVTALNIGEKGYIPSGVILWLPNVCAIIAGLFFWKKVLKR
ncbi:LptF/LptG family permease [Elusimicrobiota bacterium]